jgi:hypothetical protein
MDVTCIFLFLLIGILDAKENEDFVNIDIHKVYDRKSCKFRYIRVIIVFTDQALFKTLREEQTAAVESISEVEDNKRLKPLIADIVARMKKVMVESKEVIESQEFVPSDSAFPTEDPLREAVAKILENTAFYLELAVNLPDFIDYFTHRDPEMKPLIKWCYEFVQKMDIYDSDTAAIVLNGAQELIIVPRPKDYHNPKRAIYLKAVKTKEAYEEYKRVMAINKQRMEARKKQEKMGPKLSARSEL